MIATLGQVSLGLAGVAVAILVVDGVWSLVEPYLQKRRGDDR